LHVYNNTDKCTSVFSTMRNLIEVYTRGYEISLFPHFFSLLPHYCLTCLSHFFLTFSSNFLKFPHFCLKLARSSLTFPHFCLALLEFPHFCLTRTSPAPSRIFLAFASLPPRLTLTFASQGASLLPHSYVFPKVCIVFFRKISRFFPQTLETLKIIFTIILLLTKLVSNVKMARFNDKIPRNVGNYH
jgi:hypothetical protein